jgi:hypothetical protein
MKAIEITIENKYKPILARIDHYRELILSIDFDLIFEPLQLFVTDTKDAEVKLTSIDDIISWHKELGYSFVTKINNIENQILYLIDQEDIYSASILLRHHMEQCGYITLALDKFIEFMKENSLEILEKFIAKTSFGSPLSNNKKTKNLLDAFMTTKTPNIVSFINALDTFIEKNYSSPDNKFIFTKNYTMLNHFAHPSSLSSVFFIDSREVENGHEIKFRYKQNALGDFGKYNTLRLLEQNILVGYTSYFIFNSFEFFDDKIIQNIDKVKLCWENIIGVYKKSNNDNGEI